MDISDRERDTRLWRFLLDRRAVLKGGGAALAAAAAPGTLPAYAAPAKPLHFIGWQYNPQIVAENVDIFKKLYDENVEYELVSGEYHAIAETKLIAGQHIDMMYSEEDHLVRWWTRRVGARHRRPSRRRRDQGDDVRGQRRELSLPNGKLGGLPYYTGFNSFVFNDKASREGQAAAADDVGRIPRPVPQAEEGRHRRVPLCQRLAAAMGEPVVEPVLDLVLRGRQGLRRQVRSGVRRQFKKVLELHRTLYAEGLVPPDIFTRPGERADLRHRPAHLHGRARIRPEGLQRPRDCRRSPAPRTTSIMPGATRSTFIWTALYLMGAKPVDVARACNLMQFFGGKAKDGQYHVAERWALEFGLGTPYKEVIDEPGGPRPHSRKWKDLEVSTKQQETATTRDVSKTMWFPEWDWYMMGEVQDFIRGQQPIDQLIDKLQKKAVEVKQLYPE